MVNNSTNINKVNNQLSPLTIEQKKKITYGNGFPSPGLEQAPKCGSVKLNGIPTLPILIIGSPTTLFRHGLYLHYSEEIKTHMSAHIYRN
jgi:hypothetical protein